MRKMTQRPDVEGRTAARRELLDLMTRSPDRCVRSADLGRRLVGVCDFRGMTRFMDSLVAGGWAEECNDRGRGWRILRTPGGETLFLLRSGEVHWLWPYMEVTWATIRRNPMPFSAKAILREARVPRVEDITLEFVRRYCIALRNAGVLVLIEGAERCNGVWRLVRSKDTGPLPFDARGQKEDGKPRSVRDLNTGELVFDNPKWGRS